MARWFFWLMCLCFVPAARPRSKEERMVLLIKLVVFVDSSLEQHLENNLKIPKEEQLGFIEAYVRQVESNFSGLRSDLFDKISLKVVGLRRYEPAKMLAGDIDELLGDFCDYQSEVRETNRGTDWQLALLLTSVDLFSGEDTRDYGSLEKSRSTMGVSVIDGINWPGLSCLIVEFGVNFNQTLELEVNDQDRGSSGKGVAQANTSRGFGSTWVAAHEIAHSLGIHHDGPPFNPQCDNNWIMSPESKVGAVSLSWSDCSLDQIRIIAISSNLTQAQDEGRAGIDRMPGQLFDLRAQCATFSASLEFFPINSKKLICNETVWCRATPSGQASRAHLDLVAIGPALEGTICDDDGYMICYNHKCTQLGAIET